MVKALLYLVGWLAVLVASTGIAIRVAGSDAMVRQYAGGSRNLDFTFYLLVVGLIFLALAAILTRLDTLLAQREE
ncbi:hypothetical protein [Pararhodobacter aggregans]|uniref:Uncharacterized protein n=1 Tax=Pararhodobacter aggregans TaxID=404875 RepID=A0A2T7UTS0_9RHOB|nr:hypothetical protein [Pararhodobacter aggregans]PVE47971.1 hypothetical protein DDE23_07445 [Pararhodobacter aggregans]